MNYNIHIESYSLKFIYNVKLSMLILTTMITRINNWTPILKI